MITEQERRRRRITLRFIQLSLILLTIGMVGAFFAAKRTTPRERGPDFELSSDVPQVSTDLGPGDLQIFNRDSSVELILHGPRILAGLSPKTVAKIRAKMDESTREQSGMGAAIAKAVTDQVSDKIEMHVQYDVADIEDIRLEDDRIVIEWKSGKEQEMFGSVKTDGRESNRFRESDAQRFIDAVKARQKTLRP